MNSIEIIEVKSKKDLNDFIKLPSHIYSNDPYYVPPLKSEIKNKLSNKNPFFLHAEARYFIAKKNGNPAGRIASIINYKHIEFHNERAGFFGLFECIDDVEVASSLINIVSKILKSKGMDLIRGPMNLSTNEECGLLIDGFDNHPMIMTPYNPPYYKDLIEQCYMKKAKDLYAYIYYVQKELPSKVYRVAEIAEKKGISVRHINIKKFNDEMSLFKDVYTSAWKNNWGFIPPTDEEIRHMGESLKKIIVPELTLIAEKDNQPIGFMGLFPDFNFVLKHMKGKINPVTILKAIYFSKKIKDLRLLLLGIKEQYRNKGIEALLFREGFKGVKKGGYRHVEFSWILEDNIPVQRVVEMTGAKLYKIFRIYEKKI